MSARFPSMKHRRGLSRMFFRRGFASRRRGKRRPCASEMTTASERRRAFDGRIFPAAFRCNDRTAHPRRDFRPNRPFSERRRKKRVQPDCLRLYGIRARNRARAFRNEPEKAVRRVARTFCACQAARFP